MSYLCVVCGTESEKCICDKCKQTADIEQLCNEIIAYTPMLLDNPNANPVWEAIAKTLDYSKKFREFAFDLAEELDSPRKEYQQIHSITGEYTSIPRAKKPWFYEVYEKCINMDGLSDWERLRLKGMMLDALYMDYRYFDADELAIELVDVEELPWQTAGVLADFYTKTRRYDEAETVLANARAIYAEVRAAINQFDKVAADCEKYRTNSENGKKEYMPNPREDKDKAVANYIEFLNSIGIDVKVASKTPKPIPKAEYPEPVIITVPNFDSFVAYDFETTGLSSSADSIIEIGAVKVVNGEVVDSKEFIFSEFVKPYKKSLSDQVSALTGITREDIQDARPMWDVVKDFMDFVGDDVLVGYNNVAFDSKFLARAGRYGHVLVTNPQFDVLKYIRQVKDQIGYDGENCKLTTLGEYYGIENPAAHRAWADAITTAKVYLKLKELS